MVILVGHNEMTTVISIVVIAVCKLVGNELPAHNNMDGLKCLIYTTPCIMQHCTLTTNLQTAITTEMF